MFNANINNISVYMAEETGPDYQEKTTHPSQVTHNVVSSTHHHERDSSSQR
jgi:hypothetical protein